MHRFYLSPDEISGPQLRLRAGDAHHAQRVLRLCVGDEVAVLDGAGHEHRCAVAREARGEVTLEIRETRSLPAPPWQITIYQAVTKAKSMDFVMQKATELGVHRIVPVLTQRSVPSFGGEDARNKASRWRDLAIEALKQCGTPWLPVIEAPIPFAQAVARQGSADLAFVGSLREHRRHPRQQLDRFRAEQGREPATVSVWVGPEGDFTPAELDALEASGVLPITLGPLVLRAETATIYCLAFLSYELQAGHPASAQARIIH